MRLGSPRSFFFLILIWAWILPCVPASRAEMKPRFAMIPFFIEKEAVCPVCKGVFAKGEILPGSHKKVTRLLQQKMEAIETFQVLSLETVEESLAHWNPRRFEEKLTPSSIELGRELKVDFVAVPLLFRFEERIGSAIGVERPASVGFDIHLFRVKDGKRVWDGKFDETQRPLSENLFKIGSFLRRKASWLTAEELASVGMDEMLKKLPSPQELEEKR
ncbi:MAG: hypothetical protein ACE144_10385 [Thermodesulfobacteriota bacterium]